MSTPTPDARSRCYLGHLDALDAARTKSDAGAVWAAADEDRDRFRRLTDTQHAVIAGRAEELIATLPAVRVPAQRNREVAA